MKARARRSSGMLVLRDQHRLRIPGGAILPAYDAMLDYPIRHVLVRHEQGATHMAAATPAPAAASALRFSRPPVRRNQPCHGHSTAQMDSSPMVCITGRCRAG